MSMSFDTFATAAIATELRNTLLGGRVQRVTQINSLTFGFEIFIRLCDRREELFITFL